MHNGHSRAAFAEQPSPGPSVTRTLCMPAAVSVATRRGQPKQCSSSSSGDSRCTMSNAPENDCTSQSRKGTVFAHAQNGHRDSDANNWATRGTYAGPQKHLPKRLAWILVRSSRRGWDQSRRQHRDAIRARGRTAGSGKQRVWVGHLEDFIELYGSSGHGVLGGSWARIPCRRAREAAPSQRPRSQPAVRTVRRSRATLAQRVPREERHESARHPVRASPAST
jgi:hypothetical protein